MQYIIDLLNDVGVRNSQSQTAIIVLISVYTLVLVLRLVIYLGYRGSYSVFSFGAKRAKIEGKAELSALKIGAVSRALKEYIRLAERGIAVTNVKDIVERSISGLSFLGWNYKSIDRFIDAMDRSLLIITAILAFFFENKTEIVIAGGGVFAILRVVSAFLDYSTLRERFIGEASSFIEFEAGRFYPSGLPSSINMLRIEITNAVQAQSVAIEKILALFGKDIKAITEKAMSAMVDSVKTTLVGFEEFDNRYYDSIKAWEAAIAKATELQKQLNAASQNLQASFTDNARLNDKISKSFEVFSARLKEHYSGMDTLAAMLRGAVDKLTESNGGIEAKNNLITEQMDTIRKSHRALEAGVSQFETTVMGLTKEMGEAFGRIVDYHAKAAYESMGMEMSGYIKQAFGANNELIQHVQTLFDQIREQNRAEAKTLINMKEQMDMQYEAIMTKNRNDG